MRVHAVILSGGQGSRLGNVRKGTLRIAGTTLQERLTAHFRTLGVEPLISTRRGPHLPGMTAPDLVDPDLPIGGPLAGVIAAAEHLQSCADDDILISASVDAPFLPDDYVRRLVAALDDGAGAAMARWRHNFYPTHAAWRLSALRSLPEDARAGRAPASLKALLAQGNATQVDWGNSSAHDPFANINTLSDLLALARRAIAKGS